MDNNSDSIISIGKEVECEDLFAINIPVERPPAEQPECNELFDININILAELPPAEWSECCIYRVPNKLREVNIEAYTPKLVSIGPFHHRGKELRYTEKKMHKLRYLKAFLDRTGKSHEDLLKIIQDDEEKIRHCYAEDCGLKSNNNFAKMILLDAIFIIELFRRTKPWRPENGENDENDESDYIVNKPWLANGIRLDLILLENQLPFFVLEKLYMFAGPDYHRAQKGGKNKKVTFLELSINYFSVYYSNLADKQLPNEFNIEEVKHFTDLIRHVLCSGPSLTMKHKGDLDSRICATKLDDAGLKFNAVQNRHLLEITMYSNLGGCPCFNLSWLLSWLPFLNKPFPRLERMQCILEFPPIVIDNTTEAFFRNLIALEQCHYPSKTYICSYVALLDYLIDTEKDVDLLVQKKVIVNNIGSNQAVADAINKLCLEIVVDQSCYSDLGTDINKYSENHWNRIMATMKSEFYCNFWRGTATTVALVIMLYQFWGFLRPFIFKK
ncbi:UPF0481 protein At3g47200-like [Corylus avellana]|uniref:UPF0481 protein At3g47200-like n=1 Tax=Corylus avellana TaxID=13451 RepID=UPI00286BBA61|nr:UPF0481 protein At3g47200-like [Corylus avellana]